MSTSEFNAGLRAGLEAICSGQRVDALLTAVVNQRGTPQGRARLGGLVSALCIALDECHKAAQFNVTGGTNPRLLQVANAMPSARLLLMRSLFDDLYPSGEDAAKTAQAAFDTLRGICATVQDAVAKIDVKDALSRRLQALDQPTPTAAASVTQGEVAPLQVQIVGMPERITSTTVARDATGDIAETRQVEKDAVNGHQPAADASRGRA